MISKMQRKLISFHLSFCKTVSDISYFSIIKNKLLKMYFPFSSAKLPTVPDSSAVIHALLNSSKAF